MKKLFTLFACVGLLFSLSACSSSKVEDEALDRLEASIKKFSEVQSFDYTIGADMGDQGKMEISGTFLSEGPQLSMVMDMEAQGVTLDKFMELYLKENTMYMSAMGTKMKQEADTSEFSGISFDPDTMNFDRDALKENLDEATLSGNTLHLTVKEDLLKDNEAQMNSFASVGIDKITAVSMDIELENDFIKDATIELKGTDADGKAASFQIYLKLNDINAAKEITYPEDLDTWPLAEDSGLLG